MLAQSYAPVIGGEERVVEELGRELAARGHEVSVATLSDSPSDKGDGGGPVRVHRVPTSLNRLPGASRAGDRPFAPPVPDPLTVRGLREVVRAEGPEVVHAHNWIVHSYLPLRRRNPAPLVLSLHDYGLLCSTKRLFREGAPCSGPGLAKCVRCAGAHYGRARGSAIALAVLRREARLRRAVDLFLPISEAVRDNCRLGPEDRHEVIPDFIGDLPAAPADPELRGLPDGPYILYYGDVSEDKGALFLAAAYATLDDAPPLVMIGRRLLDSPLSHPGITVLGPLPYPAVVEAVRRSLFTVAPSLWPEPFGLVALEAAAAGRPVIASDIGGLRDIVADGESGLLVGPGDVTALAQALQRLAGDSALRKRMGEAASVRAGTFSSDAIVPRFERAYERALAGSPAGRDA